MDYVNAIILGILQGLCEFLPISSSGHLSVAQHMLGITEGALLMDVMLHVGTLAAVLIYFRNDVLYLIRHPLSMRTLLLVIATVPAVLMALLLPGAVEAMFSGRFLGLAFLVTSLLVYIISRCGGVRTEVRPADALGMGVMQAVALLPGVSRSGATIAGGALMGLTREEAARFSFLMSIPAILGSLVLQLKDIAGGALSDSLPPTLLGMAVAAVTGYIAIRWMMDVVRKGRVIWFSVYTLALGALVLLDQLAFHRFFPPLF